MGLPRILLVDDVEFFLEMEKDLLSSTPASIFTARNGREALESIRRQRPDMIFMDVVMPVMDGISCCRILKSDPLLKSIPVIMVFAPSREVDAKTVEAAGCDGYLTKPIDRKVFLEMGRRFLFDVERREPRISCQLQVTVNRPGEEFHCTCEDLGVRGMFINSQNPLPVDEVIRVTMFLPGSSAGLECRARVSWVNQDSPEMKLHLPSGFGVEFLQPSQGTIASIRAFLKNQSGN